VNKAIPAKLHVLTLTPFYPSEGDEVKGCYVAESLRQLQRQGAMSSVIAVDSIYHAKRRPNPEFPAEWIRYPQLPGNFGLSSAGNFLGAALQKRVRQLHQRSPIDVIHAHAALPCGHAAAFLAQRLGVPFVVTIHSLDVFNRCFQDGMAARWRRKASSEVYKRARKVICISDTVRRLLADGLSGVSTEVVYNGTDTDFFVPGSPQNQTSTILLVGTMLAGKGQELILRAVARIKDSYPGLRIRMIGEGGDRDRFAELAEALGIRNSVDFEGKRSRSEVAEAMRTCTIFALPSRFEGLGCVYLEAMACGKPVIGCRGQGIEEIIHHQGNGWLIPVDGLDELVSGLKTLLEDAELRSRIGQAARQTVLESLTLSHQAERLMKIYKEAAE